MKNLLLALSSILIIGSASAQLPKGDRILAYQVDMTENLDYDTDFNLAIDACMESTHLFFTWADLEPSSGNYDTSFISGFLDLANFYYPLYGAKAELQIAPINTNVLEVPSDLAATPMNSPAMINAFKTMLDTAFAHIPDLELNALNIGNESEIYLGTDALAYAQFGEFLDSVIPHAKQLYFNIHGTELKVGTTFTFDGLTKPSTSALCASVNTNRDIITTTYYPLTPAFHMESPTVVSGDFTDLVNLYPDTNQPIYFAECGYSSSATCSSSEALQADFFTEVFSAWDQHYDNIKYLTIFKTTDWSAADVAVFETYYGISDPAFLEYLRTLGVRTWPGAGTDKLAFDRIKCELEARNWCSIQCTASLNENSNPKLIISPNPIEDFASIDTEEQIESIEVISIEGKSIQFESSSVIDARNLVSGIYIMKVSTSSGIHIIRFEKR